MGFGETGRSGQRAILPSPWSIAPVGIEHMATLPEKPQITSGGGAPGGAPDADLALLAQAWPSLPAPIRAGVMALVKAAQVDKL